MIILLIIKLIYFLNLIKLIINNKYKNINIKKFIFLYFALNKCFSKYFIQLLLQQPKDLIKKSK